MAQIDIGETAERVLTEMHHIEQRNAGVNDDPVLAKSVRRRLGMSNQLLNYHLNRLEDQGLIEVVGTVDVDAPQPAKEYRLTVDGAKVAAASKARQNVAGEFEALREKADEVDDLRSDVRVLQQQVDDLEEKLGAVIDHLKEKERAAQSQ